MMPWIYIFITTEKLNFAKMSVTTLLHSHDDLFPHMTLASMILKYSWHSYKIFIHSNLISCSLIGSFVNTRSVLKMSTALRVLRPDCARCFWRVIARVNVTSTDPFFHWVKLLIFLMFSGILRPFYL